MEKTKKTIEELESQLLKLEQGIQQDQEFNVLVVNDLKGQLADMADQKAVLAAFNIKKDKMLQQLSEQNKSLSERLQLLETKLAKINNAGPIPVKEGEKE